MKTKKFLAALLSSAMVLGTLAVPVMAEGITANTEWYNNAQEETTEYTISTAAELAGLATLVNGGNNFKNKTIKLGADIDLENKNWTPIGTKNNYFAGNFDGGNHKISNLKIASSDSYVGLFGDIEGNPTYANLNTFKDLTIENVDITGVAHVGSAIGYSYGFRESNIKVTGSINIKGNYNVGGIIGAGYFRASNLTVEGTGNNNTITGVYKEGKDQYGNELEGDNVGGIAGFSRESGTEGTVVMYYTYDNLSVSNVNVTGTRKIGGVFGTIYCGSEVTNVNVSDVTVGTNAEPTYATPTKSRKGLGGFAGVYVDDPYHVGSIEKAKISNVSFSVPEGLTFSAGPVTGGKGSYPLEEPTLSTVSDVTVNCTGATNAFLVTKVTGGEYKVDVHKYLSAGLAEKEDNGTYTVIPLSQVVPNLTGVVTIKSAVEDKTYEQVSALVTNIQGNTKDFNVTTSGDEDTQNITNQKITLKDIGHYDGDVLCGLIIKNIPEGVTVTVTAAE